jgi:hypothetical protein
MAFEALTNGDILCSMQHHVPILFENIPEGIPTWEKVLCSWGGGGEIRLLLDGKWLTVFTTVAISVLYNHR